MEIFQIIIQTQLFQEYGQLDKVVKDNKCDIGLAFDGDGDRLGVVDNLGNLVWADQYMLYYTEIANYMIIQK